MLRKIDKGQGDTMRLRSLSFAVRVCALAWSCALVAMVLAPASSFAALPEGRVYELVSPADKGPFFAKGPVVGADGERIAFTGAGAFEGSPAGLAGGTGYLASRNSEKWQTSPLAPPAVLSRLVSGQAPVDFSPDLSLSVSVLDFAPEHSLEQSSQTVFVHNSDAPDVTENFTALSPPLSTLVNNSVVFYQGASADFRRVIYKSNTAFIPEDTTKSGLDRLYESTSSSPSSLKLVGVETDGKVIDPNCEVEPGSVLASSFHAISADGSEVFFEVCGALYVRVNGSETVQLSPSGVFYGASRDGSRVFFSEGGSLYEDQIQAGVVSAHVLVAEGLQGVTRISEDGSRVYFVSDQILTSSKNGLEQGAVAGAENLYVYDTLSREARFVAELCSGMGLSGSVSGVGQCPGTGSDKQLWQTEDERPVQTSGCVEEGTGACEPGRYLVFDTYAQLIRSGPEADTDTAVDVYRYDALTGLIRRVSVGVEGHDHNGNDDAFNATIRFSNFRNSELFQQYQLDDRTISENGTVVFSTSGPLSADAVNGVENVYVWHEEDGVGRDGMISSGSSATNDEYPVIDISGGDVFFVTTAGLVSQDTDGLEDVYDARIDGGFPTAPLRAGGCSGAACQGPPSIPQLLAAPASATFSGLGNPPLPGPEPVVKKKSVVKPLTSAQKLAVALRACKREPKGRRKGCESRARKRYAKQASKGGGRA